MKLPQFDYPTIIFLMLFVILSILILSEWMLGKSDAKYEEATEQVIKHVTGLDIDLTPESEE